MWVILHFMELVRGNEELEKLNKELNDPARLRAYEAVYDGYRPALVPRILGGFLVGCGNLFYGREPSYLKFRAVEVIARVPYHSWSSAAYTLLTVFYKNEARALKLAGITKFARLSQDNETMHVVVISHLAAAEERPRFLLHTAVPMCFAFFYFWWSYALYLLNPRYSYELNFLFEQHAFEQYSRFLEVSGEKLKHKKIESGFLSWYGRHPANQYEFFRSVRNDELIHRNSSISEMQK